MKKASNQMSDELRAAAKLQYAIEEYQNFKCDYPTSGGWHCADTRITTPLCDAYIAHLEAEAKQKTEDEQKPTPEILEAMGFIVSEFKIYEKFDGEFDLTYLLRFHSLMIEDSENELSVQINSIGQLRNLVKALGGK